jgi:hypothetical protein
MIIINFVFFYQHKFKKKKMLIGKCNNPNVACAGQARYYRFHPAGLRFRPSLQKKKNHHVIAQAL